MYLLFFCAGVVYCTYVGSYKCCLNNHAKGGSYETVCNSATAVPFGNHPPAPKREGIRTSFILDGSTMSAPGLLFLGSLTKLIMRY